MSLAPYIDHTLLKPDATEANFRSLCEEARTHQFYAVCVPSSFVPDCRTWLMGTSVKVATVIGFPHGNASGKIKAYEAQWAFENGANEVDMVLNISALKSANYALVAQDLRQVRSALSNGQILKVIIETGLLNRNEKIVATQLVSDSGADFIKTCTGFSPGEATVEDVLLFKEYGRKDLKIKASGGVRSAARARDLISAGAVRLGTSSGVALVKGASVGSGY